MVGGSLADEDNAQEQALRGAGHALLLLYREPEDVCGLQVVVVPDDQVALHMEPSLARTLTIRDRIRPFEDGPAIFDGRRAPERTRAWGRLNTFPIQDCTSGDSTRHFCLNQTRMMSTTTLRPSKIAGPSSKGLIRSRI